MISCPYCGESYYKENYKVSTAMYYTPIYRNGVNINPDRNSTSVCCTCLVCGKDFFYGNEKEKENYGI